MDPCPWYLGKWREYWNRMAFCCLHFILATKSSTKMSYGPVYSMDFFLFQPSEIRQFVTHTRSGDIRLELELQ